MDYKPNFTTEKVSMNNNKADNYENSYVVTELEKYSLFKSTKFYEICDFFNVPKKNFLRYSRAFEKKIQKINSKKFPKSLENSQTFFEHFLENDYENLKFSNSR